MLCLLLFAGSLALSAPPRPVLDSPFFPYTYRRMRDNDKIIANLGYDTFPTIYSGINLEKNPPYPENLEERIAKAASDGPGMLWLTVRWPEDNETNRREAVKQVLKLADRAREAGWKTSIYPHTGDSIDMARRALPFVERLDRPDIGLTLNLAHELRNRQGAVLLETVDLVKDHLNMVTVNGAADVVKKHSHSWKDIIQPLGRGDFDLLPLLRKLQTVGYTGPFGLQCFGIEGDTYDILSESMTAWKALMKKLEKNPSPVSKNGVKRQ